MPLSVSKFCIEFVMYVVCGCETWSLTPREEHRMRVFENRVLRKIFGPMRDEVIGECRRLYRRKFDSSFVTKYSGDHITRNKMSKARSMYGGRRGAFRVLVRKPE